MIFAVCAECLKLFLNGTIRQNIRVRCYILLWLGLVLFVAVSLTTLYKNSPTQAANLHHREISPGFRIQSVINAIANRFTSKATNPKLLVYPNVKLTSKIVLIWYDEKDTATIDRLTNSISEFLEGYETPLHHTAPFCNFNHPPRLGEVCPVDIENFGPCSFPYYGYYGTSPCIFLKLSQGYDWIPDCYNSTDQLPPEMPEGLVTEVKLAQAKHEGNQVWVSCQGEHTVDKNHVEGFAYYPKRGVPFYHFPFRHKRDEHSSPIIAVQIVNPTPGVMIGIACRLWAKNVDDQSGEALGSVHFGIMKDSWNGAWGSREDEHHEI